MILHLYEKLLYKSIVHTAFDPIFTLYLQDKLYPSEKHIEIPYITATHDVNNPRSGRVMQAIGMKYRYSYNELWQPKNKWVTFRMYPLNLDGQENRIYKKYWNKYPIHFVETIPK